MAKLEQVLNGDFGRILKTIENGILNDVIIKIPKIFALSSSTLIRVFGSK